MLRIWLVGPVDITVEMNYENYFIQVVTIL